MRGLVGAICLPIAQRMPRDLHTDEPPDSSGKVGNEGMEKVGGGGGGAVGLVHTEGLWARRSHTPRPRASTLLLD